MKKSLLLLLGAALMAGMVVGCGDSAVNENRPIEEVRAEAAKLDAAAIQKKVDALNKAIAEKTKELEAAIKKVSEIPLSEILGEEAKKAKDKVAEITVSCDKLKEQLKAYMEALSKNEK